MHMEYPDYIPDAKDGQATYSEKFMKASYK